MLKAFLKHTVLIHLYQIDGRFPVMESTLTLIEGFSFSLKQFNLYSNVTDYVSYLILTSGVLYETNPTLRSL